MQIDYRAIFRVTPLVKLVAIGISVVFVLITLGLRFDFKPSDWAAWVQALGSVGALVGIWYTVRAERAFALNREQHKALLLTMDRLAPFSHELGLLCEDMHFLHLWLVGEQVSADEFFLDHSQFERVFELIRTTALPVPEAAIELSKISHVYRYMKLARNGGVLPSTPYSRHMADASLQKARAAIFEVRRYALPPD